MPASSNASETVLACVLDSIFFTSVYYSDIVFSSFENEIKTNATTITNPAIMIGNFHFDDWATLLLFSMVMYFSPFYFASDYIQGREELSIFLYGLFIFSQTYWINVDIKPFLNVTFF